MDLSALLGGQDPQQQQQQAPQQPQGKGLLDIALSPLGQSLLAGYFGAIGAPRLSGWGGALSRGGLAALGQLGQATQINQRGQALQQQEQLQSAYQQRALAQAEKANELAQQSGAMIFKNRDTGEYTSIKKGDPDALKNLAAGHWEPWGESAQAAEIKAEGTKEKSPGWKMDTFTNQEGHEIKVPVKINPDGTTEFPPNFDASQISMPGEGNTGLRPKQTTQEKQQAMTVDAARQVGGAAMQKLAALKEEGKTQGWLGNKISAGKYWAGMEGDRERDSFYTSTDATKAQLIAAALKESGNRSIQLVRMIETHFPNKFYSDAANEQRFHDFFDQGGIMDQWDHWRQSGFQGDEPQYKLPSGAAGASGGAKPGSDLPPPPPVPVQDMFKGPKGETVVLGTDGKYYQFGEGGWQLTK